MERVVVTVKWHDDHREQDFDLPSNLPARQLVELLAEAFVLGKNANSAQGNYRILANPPGRVLDLDETLAQVGAWDGAVLVVQQADNATLDAFQNKKSAHQIGMDVNWSGPLLGFKPLEIELSASDSSDLADFSPDNDGYVWKPIEE